MQTTKNRTGGTAMMQCPCGMQGPGRETSDTGTFRERHFESFSKDDASRRHTSTFTWDEDQGRMTGTCHGSAN